MNRYTIAILLFFGLFLTGFMACGRATSQGDPAELGYTLYYLTEDKIYKVILPNRENATLVYASPAAQPGESFDINTLRQGPHGTLMFHVHHITGLFPATASSARTRMSVSTYDIKTGRLTSLVGDPDVSVSFPVLSQDESQVAMHGREAFFIKDLKEGKMLYYAQFAAPLRRLFPSSWSPDGKLLALSGGEPGKTSTIYFFDTEKNTLTPWRPGMQPHFSPNGQLVAYFTPAPEGKLIIADRDGNVLQAFGGFLFRNLEGWIGEDRVLFTIACGTYAHPYKNHIGIADLKTKKIYDIEVPTNVQINGVVVADRD